MNRYLIDTCTFLWLIDDYVELPDIVKNIIRKPENTIYLSTVSAWEISIKYGSRKLGLARDPSVLVPEEREKHGISLLTVDETASLNTHKLPAHHQDPFDRLLISQCLAQNLIMLTPDKHFSLYPIRVVWE